MAKWIKDFFTYLDAVFVESTQRIFTSFDVLGIVLLLFPHLAEKLIKDVSLVRIIGAAIFLGSFVLANFTLYRKTAQENSLVKLQLDSFKVTRIGWVEWSLTDSSPRIADTIGVSFRGWVECTNPLQVPTTVKFTIDSIDSEWQTSFDLTSITLDTNDPQMIGGRLRLEPLVSKRLQISFGIPFDSPRNKLDFGYLGSLSKMVVVLAVEQPNQKIWYLHIDFDTTEMHQLIEDGLMNTVLNHLDRAQGRQKILDRNLLSKVISTVVEIIGKLRID